MPIRNNVYLQNHLIRYKFFLKSKILESQKCEFDIKIQGDFNRQIISTRKIGEFRQIPYYEKVFFCNFLLLIKIQILNNSSSILGDCFSDLKNGNFIFGKE